MTESDLVLFCYYLTLALCGLGRHTKLGGSMLVAAISGSMGFPPMTGAVVVRRVYLLSHIRPLLGSSQLTTAFLFRLGSMPILRWLSP